MRWVARAGAVLAVVGALLAVPATARAATPPANDDFADARVVTGLKGAAYGTLAGATIEPNCAEPMKSKFGGHGDRSVWIKWVAPTHGWVRFDLHVLDGSTAYLDAFRSRGHCMNWGGDATLEPAPGVYGQLQVRRGEALWFAVYSYGANAGPFAVSWRTIPAPAPLNDSFGATDVIWGRHGKHWATTENATRQAGEPVHAGRAGGRSVWFTWQAPQSGPAMFHVSGSTAWSCLLGIYKGTSVGALTTVAADASSYVANTCTARFTATAGVRYRIAVDGESGDSDFVLVWNSGPRPPNDAIAGATVLPGFRGVVNGTNRGATDEAGEPRSHTARSGSSVWYRWTAPGTGRAYVELDEPLLWTMRTPMDEFKRLAVFTGSPSSLTSVAASPPAPAQWYGAEFDATKNTTYWFQVTGYEEQVLHYQLFWRLEPRRYDTFANAAVLPAAGTMLVDNQGATAEPGEPIHGGGSVRRSIWFSWTAPQTETVTFEQMTDSGNADPDFDLAAYTGTSVGALTPVPMTFANRRWSLAATAGVTYRIALDDAGGIGWGRPRRIAWYTGTPDLDAPAVTMTAPAEDAVVSGLVATTATATDASGVSAAGFGHDWLAEFHEGPQPLAGPYQGVLDTDAYPDGPFGTKAWARDVRGNYAATDEHRLVIENRPPALMLSTMPGELFADSSVGFSWGSDEPVASVLCSLDGAAYTDDCFEYGPGSKQGALAWGGVADGVHVIRAVATDLHGKQTVDPAASWFVVDTKGVGVLTPPDTTAPTITAAPTASLRAGTDVGNVTAPVFLSWASRDAVSFVQRHELQRSTDGGAWQPVPSGGNATGGTYWLARGHTYRFRVRAVDWAGNVSSWAVGPSFSVGLAQEHSGWTYSAGWTRTAYDGTSGGYVMRTGVSGARARYAFTGRSVALYALRLPSFGRVAIYLDGAHVSTVDLGVVPDTRVAAFVRNRLDPNVRHVLEVRTLGPAAIDAVTWLR